MDELFSNKLLSIDIGTKNTKLAVGYVKNNVINIENLIEFPTPSNTYEDGKILSIDRLKDNILSTLKQHNIKVKKCIFSLSSTSLITREIVLPAVKNEDLKSMVIMEVEQYLPMILKDDIVEYKVVEEFEENEIDKIRVLVAVLSKEIVERYLKLIHEMKMTPVALDIHGNSISKLFTSNIHINDENYSSKETVAIIDIGVSSINVSIIYDGNLRFSRIIDFGGKDIDIAISNAYNLSLEDGEKKKIDEVNLDPENFNNLEISSIVNEVARTTVDNWIQEIQRIFQYYTSRSLSNRISKVYILGGNASIFNIEKYINRGLNIPTFKIKNMENIKFKKEFENIDFGRYLNAIGAMVRK